MERVSLPLGSPHPGLHRHGDAAAARGGRRVRVRADATWGEWGRELREGGDPTCWLVVTGT